MEQAYRWGAGPVLTHIKLARQYRSLAAGSPVRVELSPEYPTAGLCLAAAAWSVAFGLFVWHYWPMLSRPRPDGGPG